MKQDTFQDSGVTLAMIAAGLAALDKWKRSDDLSDEKLVVLVFLAMVASKTEGEFFL